MSTWFAKVAVLVSLLGFIVIRWPHGHRSGTVRVVEDRKGGLEIGLLIGALSGTTLIPLVWLLSPVFKFADYPLHPVLYVLGLVVMVPGLWLFHRSHTDLGTNWSVTLQMREDHALVTSGVYARIRHPMYTSMFLLGIAQVLFLPNWIVGPAYLVGFGAAYIFRVKHEERMMLDRFSSEYEEYMRRSGRLIPRLGQRPNSG
jgi:protein-S-isoprenylcysteine O-methyltransferase Ste14